MEPIGEEGWGLVAKALQTHFGLLSGVTASKDAYAGAKKDNMRVVWEALKRKGKLVVARNTPGAVTGEDLLKQDGEAAWTRFCQILDLSNEEWDAQRNKRD